MSLLTHTAVPCGSVRESPCCGAVAVVCSGSVSPLAVCPPGWFGPDCQQSCSCGNEGHCHPVTGTCSCAPGWTGYNCQRGIAPAVRYPSLLEDPVQNCAVICFVVTFVLCRCQKSLSLKSFRFHPASAVGAARLLQCPSLQNEFTSNRGWRSACSCHPSGFSEDLQPCLSCPGEQLNARQ